MLKSNKRENEIRPTPKYGKSINLYINLKDVFMDNSYWDDNNIWGPFDSVFDAEVFYYQPEYYNGYVEWYSYGEDIVGVTLRFHKMHIK